MYQDTDSIDRFSSSLGAAYCLDRGDGSNTIRWLYEHGITCSNRDSWIQRHIMRYVTAILLLSILCDNYARSQRSKKQLYKQDMKTFFAHETECPQWVDSRIYMSGSKVQMGVTDRARRTIPSVFYINTSSIQGAGLGVFSRTFLRKDIWLGEYEGIYKPINVTLTEHQWRYSWLVSRLNHVTHVVDGSDVTRSNWLRYMNCARHVSEENVHTSMCYGRIHYRLSRDLYPGKELLVYYGDAYAKLLGIDIKQYTNMSHHYQDQNRTRRK
ncbi:hypothetical protein LSH36_4g11039 [Paralvinella palmiformis]|uniref:SET domain-containing protein n=1 Tax=Paralvinella palmiformis TaxID=53620 RepID=A0AAD9KF94_9ANNE|nr:hypothetical protein LSH36_4g11039 [Paralvinella palmiformis]